MRKVKAALFVLGMCAVIGMGTAEAQTRPAMVRDVDEPARVPYYHSFTPTTGISCPFLNQCRADFPVVPAGKRLRVTSISGILVGLSSSGIAVLNLNNTSNPMEFFQMSPVGGAYYGAGVVRFWHDVDVYFEAGQRPVLEVGVAAGLGGIPSSASNRLSISGYIVDVAP